MPECAHQKPGTTVATGTTSHTATRIVFFHLYQAIFPALVQQPALLRDPYCVYTPIMLSYTLSRGPMFRASHDDTDTDHDAPSGIWQRFASDALSVLVLASLAPTFGLHQATLLLPPGWDLARGNCSRSSESTVIGSKHSCQHHARNRA